MNKSIAAAVLGSVLALASIAPAVSAPEQAAPAFTVYRSKPAKANELFERAVNYMKSNPAERSFAAFNNQGGMFHKDDLYVFVVGIEDGIMHAYGAAPEAIVGDSVRELRDAQGTPIIQKMLDVVSTKGSGTVEYVWLNRITNRVEAKTSQVTRVGDYLLGVGYYTR